MELYGIIDKSAGRVLDIFPAQNDDDARMKMAQALFQCNNPIGLNKRFLCILGMINMENGLVLGNKSVKEIVSLDILFASVVKERKKYGK